MLLETTPHTFLSKHFGKKTAFYLVSAASKALFLSVLISIYFPVTPIPTLLSSVLSLQLDNKKCKPFTKLSMFAVNYMVMCRMLEPLRRKTISNTKKNHKIRERGGLHTVLLCIFFVFKVGCILK